MFSSSFSEKLSKIQVYFSISTIFTNQEEKAHSESQNSIFDVMIIINFEILLRYLYSWDSIIILCPWYLLKKKKNTSGNKVSKY